MLQVLYNAIITGDVTSFESMQAEKILYAEAKWMPRAQYLDEVARIAKLRDTDEDSPEEFLTDMLATELALKLSGEAAAHRYSDVTKKIQNVGRKNEDNVSSHFVELQTAAELEEFAADRDGRAMLNVLYEATITGSLTALERWQAERILAAEAKTTMSAGVAALEDRKGPAIFPLTTGRWSSGLLSPHDCCPAVK